MNNFFNSRMPAFAVAFIFLVLAPRGLMGKQHTYDRKGKRDPFISLVDSGITSAAGLEVVETIEDVKFEGVIFDPFGESMAMLNGEVVKEGDKAYNVEVVKIFKDAIIIKIYNKSYTLNLVKGGGEAVER